MKKLKVLDLFSGLGGFSLGLERTGHFETVAFCDNNKFSKLILDKHWKGIKIYDDVRAITKENFETDGIETPDIITGGFPCQPFSVAGKQKGTDDDRHLWPEMFRIIKVFQPKFVIGENVPGIVNIQDGVVFETVCTNLEDEGYEVQPFNIPAAAVGAPHQRKRIWFIAVRSDMANTNSGLHRGGRTVEPSRENGEGVLHSKKEEQAREHLRSETIGRSSIRGETKDVADANSNGTKWNQPKDGQRSRIKQSSEDVADTESIRTREFRHSDQTQGREGSSSTQFDGSSSEMADTNSERLEGFRQSRSQFNETSSSTSRSEERQGNLDQGWWSVEPNVGRVANGVSGRVHRLRGLGNSIVPQIVEEIGYAIVKAMK